MFLFLLLFAQLYAELKSVCALRSPEGAIILLYGDNHQPAPEQLKELQEILSQKTDYNVHVLVETCPIIYDKDAKTDVLSIKRCIEKSSVNIHDIECRKKMGGFLHLINPMTKAIEQRDFKTIAEDATYRSLFQQSFDCLPEDVTFKNTLSEFYDQQQKYLRLLTFLTAEVQEHIKKELDEAEINLKKIIEDYFPKNLDVSVFAWIQLREQYIHNGIRKRSTLKQRFINFCSRHIWDLLALYTILKLNAGAQTIIAVLSGGGHKVALEKYLKNMGFQPLDLHMDESIVKTGISNAELSLIIQPDPRW